MTRKAPDPPGVGDLSAREASHPRARSAVQDRVVGVTRIAPGSTAAISSKESDEDPLYDELMAVGKDEKSISPKVLAKYPQLLASREVERRAGREADNAERARCAAQALNDKINSLVESVDLVVAQAALAATPEFRGLKVNERVRKLPDGITENIFKVRRRSLFHDFVAYLRGYPPTLDPPMDVDILIPPEQSIYVAYHLESLAASALALHYAGIGAQFAQYFNFDSEIYDRAPTSYAARMGACDEYLFDTFIHMLARGRAWCDISPAYRRTATRKLSTDTDRTIMELVGKLVALWPLAPERGEAGRRGLHPTYEAVLGLGGSLYHRDLFDGVWRQSYASRRGVEPLTDYSGLLVEAICPDGVELPPSNWTLAMRAIEDDCGYEGNAIVTNGETLRELFTPFARTKLRALLKRSDLYII
jgi:hypothetical protein